jgi:very-short-patch-repair endonuclease
MPLRLVVSNEQDLVDRYVSGVSLKQLSDESGYGRNVLLARLRKHGVAVRGRSDAELLKWQSIKQDPALVQRQVRAANNACRGRKRSLAERIKGARTAARTYARLGNAEVKILDALVNTVGDMNFQHAIGPYNVDGAFRADRVAVEVQLGNLHRPNSSVAGHRIEYVLNAGWAVLLIIAQNAKRDGFDLASLTEQTRAFRDRVRRDPTCIGKYGMIGRDGQPMASFRDDLDKLPRIVGF